MTPSKYISFKDSILPEKKSLRLQNCLNLAVARRSRQQVQALAEPHHVPARRVIDARYCGSLEALKLKKMLICLRT